MGGLNSTSINVYRQHDELNRLQPHILAARKRQDASASEAFRVMYGSGIHQKLEQVRQACLAAVLAERQSAMNPEEKQVFDAKLGALRDQMEEAEAEEHQHLQTIAGMEVLCASIQQNAKNSDLDLMLAVSSLSNSCAIVRLALNATTLQTVAPGRSV